MCGNVYMGVILYKIIISDFFRIEKSMKKMSFLDIFTMTPLQRPREISQNVSGFYYVRRCAGYKIHICSKIYYLGRAKVFSSVVTDFGTSTITQVIKLPNDFYYFIFVNKHFCPTEPSSLKITTFVLLTLIDNFHFS